MRQARAGILMPMTSVPFKIKKVLDGWAEASGLLVLDGGALCFQFQTKDAVLGLLKSGVREVRVDLVDVAEASYRRKMLGAGVLTVRLASMKLAEGLPGQESGAVQLLITRANATAAQDLASSVNLEAAEARLRRTIG